MDKILFFMIYLFVSGLVLGASYNSNFERCGKQRELNTKLAIDALLWPLFIGLAVSVDDGIIKTAKCESENESKS